MKTISSILTTLAAMAGLSYAQLEPLAPPVVVERTVTETETPEGRVVEETVVETPAGFDPLRHLRIDPRVIEVAPPPAGEVVETETTTTEVGGRVYHSERSVVVVEGRELPYVTIPVLFVKETAELLDSESRAALEQTAAAILEVLKTEPTATFEVEGHASTEGTAEFNMDLSMQRAARVHAELTQRYAVPATALSARGYGKNYPMFPDGDEAQRMLDRRVLVVRTK